MVSVSNMDRVLNSVYLDVVSNCLDEKTSAFYKKIQKSVTPIAGKDMCVPCRFGINGSVACVAEDGEILPSSLPTLLLFRAPLVNIYGSVEVSDKLLRLGDQASDGVEVINSQIEALLDSAKFNLRRMLFQDGQGILCTTTADGDETKVASVDDTRNLIEGMIVDVLVDNVVVLSGAKVMSIDKANKTVRLDQTLATTITSGAIMTVSGSFRNELYGIPYLFTDSGQNLYSNSRSANSYALPEVTEDTEVTPTVLQAVIDRMEELGGTGPDMIIGSYAMRRKYLASMNEAKLNVETIVEDGFRAPGYNGIPIYAEPFIPDDTMYFVDTKDFVLGQLADWSWVEGTTHEILRPISGKAAYVATLVKYCNMICQKPKTQGKLVCA